MRKTEYQPTFELVKSCGEQIREIVECQMRQAAVNMVYELFREEVDNLCGNLFSRKGKDGFHRGGSDPGSVLIQGQRVKIKKPRVRKSGHDIELDTYSALKDYDMLCDRVKKHMVTGVSTRNYEPLLDEISGGTGLKKSSVSKAFVKASREALDDLNGRDLSKLNLVSIMMDGVGFGDATVIVALGIDTQGKKHILGLRQGDTENWQVVKDLLENLIERGLDVESRYLFVIDGSKALKKAVRKVFAKRGIVQRCVRHKERNVLSYLPKEHHSEFRRRWKLLHGRVDYTQAKNEYDRLVHWLGHTNHAALTSLEEAEMETLTVIKLKLPRLLRKTLLSTNPIESAFSIGKPTTRRVKNWKSGKDQAVRWSASVLLEAEKRFRTIRGHKEIPVLMSELKTLDVENQESVA